MKKVLKFEVASAPSLFTGLLSGLLAYATDAPKVGPSTTLWLQLRDGRMLRVRSDMHDLSGWEEIGTLTFELVREGEGTEMTGLPESWSAVRTIEKLVYDSEECEAECGFALHTMSGDVLLVLPGADVYTLAIKAPFFLQPFFPENDLEAYIRKEF